MSSPAWAQEALSDDPGYVDVHTLEQWFNGPPKVEINLTGALLDIATQATRDSDPDLAALLNEIKAIQVRIFPLDSSRYDEVEQRMSTLLNSLKAQGWETVVRVREEDEHVNIQLQMDGEYIAGLLVTVLSPGEESVFINIVGNLQPEDLSRLGETFDFGGALDTIPSSNEP